MLIRSVFFSRDNCIYSLFSMARLPSYIVKWQPLAGQRPSWKQEVTGEVHEKACTGMQRSRHGQIAVLTSDGIVNIVDSDSLASVCAPRKISTMPVTCAVYNGDDMLITGSADYTYNLIPLNSFSALSAIRSLIVQMIILVLILLFAVDFFVDDEFRQI